MPVNVNCPRCQTAYLLSDTVIGQKIRCKRCEQVFRICAGPAQVQEGIQNSPRPIPLAIRPEEDERNEHESCADESTESTAKLWILGTIIAAAMIVCAAAVGGLFLWLAFRTTPEDVSGPVAAHSPASANPVANSDAPAPSPPKKDATPIMAEAPGKGDDTIPVQTLQDLKCATAFIKVESGQVAGSGSGFLMSVQDDVGYVVTNDHVIHPKPESLPIDPFGRMMPPPIFMRPRFAGGVGRPNITVVLKSGTPQEQSLKAEIVASHKEHDLAILKITGGRDLPRPIDITQETPLVETMPVYVFGFPFGKTLATGKGNPAITVGRGSVSSIRHDDQGRLARVQIDGALNPGNSGGPVVDARGRLIGVAVATIKGSSGIGLTIPARQLVELVASGAGECTVRIVSITGQNLELEAAVDLFEFSRKQQSAALYYLLADLARAAPRASREGFRGMPEVKTQQLSIERSQARGRISVSLAAGGAGTLFTYQAVLTGADGKETLTDPAVMTLRPPAPPPRAAEAPSPTKKMTDDDITKAVADVQSTDVFKMRAGIDALARADVVADKKKEVVEALEAALKKTDHFARVAAVKALAAWAGQDAVKTLVALLKDNDVFVRFTVFDVLGPLKNAHAAPAVAERLGVLQDRGKASQALQAMGAAAEEATGKYLKDKDWRLRLEACRILKVIGTSKSVPALKEATTDANRLVGRAANDAVSTIEKKK